jgi:hypothetical protein
VELAVVRTHRVLQAQQAHTVAAAQEQQRARMDIHRTVAPAARAEGIRVYFQEILLFLMQYVLSAQEEVGKDLLISVLLQVAQAAVSPAN